MARVDICSELADFRKLFKMVPVIEFCIFHIANDARCPRLKFRAWFVSEKTEKSVVLPSCGSSHVLGGGGHSTRHFKPRILFSRQLCKG